MLNILSESEKAIIHATAITILNDTGIRIRNKKIYEMVLEAGGIPDESDNLRVYLPEKLIDEKMALCPRQFTIKNRLGEENVISSKGKSLYFTSNATHYLRGTSKEAVEVGINEFTDFVRVDNNTISFRR